jgi:hypothetical protein
MEVLVRARVWEAAEAGTRNGEQRQYQLCHSGLGWASVLGAVLDAASDAVSDAVLGAASDAVLDAALDAVLGAASDAVLDAALGAVSDAVLDAALGAVLDAALGAVSDAVSDAVPVHAGVQDAALRVQFLVVSVRFPGSCIILSNRDCGNDPGCRYHPHDCS